MGHEDADFSGYVTKAGLKCSDGRTITPEAFAHMDGKTVPLVWQHGHNAPGNVLGKAVLEKRPDGVYGYGYFNNSTGAVDAKVAVQHGDVVSMSIYANQLVEKSKQVLHGAIREVSLVIAGANPGALIENVRIAHSDGDIDELEDEAIIHTGLGLEHGDEGEAPEEGEDPEEGEQTVNVQEVLESLNEEQAAVVQHMLNGALELASDPDAEALAHAAGSEETIKDVYDGMTDIQKKVVHYMIGVALEGAEGGSAQHSADDGTETEGNLIHQEGTDMTRNLFENDDPSAGGSKTLTHDQFNEVLKDVKKYDGSFKDSMLAHAVDYGIEDIEFLFPDAKALDNNPQLKSRRMEWVAKVLDGTKHTPFAKVKSVVADITAEEARAKGYIKGNEKKDEVIKLLRRTTSPTTIYKKQKLDRDDVLDITDMDVVAFLKAEIRLMLEEEIARAILVGDGRESLSDDKIKDPEGAIDGTGIRSILHDSDLYAVKYPLDANVSAKDGVKGLVRARSKYRGSGKPTLFISDAWLTEIMLEEDKFGRPLYETEASLRDKLRVESIVTVDLFEEYGNLFAIMVNLMDYSIGTNRGGELTSFEDFDIDFNQMKYLQETRLSGGLTKPFSAVVVTRDEGTLATATPPSFDGATNTITIPTVTGVVYTINSNPVTGDVVITETTEVVAEAEEGYYLAPNTTRTWTYTPGA